MIIHFINSLIDFFKPVVLSYSRISAFNFCPWKYKLIYQDNWKIPPNPFLSLGLTVHDVLEKYHQRNLSTLEGLLSLYDELWVNLGFSDAAETMEFYGKGKRMLENYYAWEDARRLAGIMTQFVEKEFEFNIGRIKIKGIIDRVDRHPDGSYEVIDYKTHRFEWSDERLENDIQLTIYSMGCRRAFGIKPSKISYYFLAQNKCVSVNKTQLHDRDVKDIVFAVANKISSGEFSPNLNRCSKCDFFKKCPKSAQKESK